MRSVGGAEAVQPAGPFEDASVRGHEAMAGQRGGDDQAIRRIGMEIDELHGPDADLTVNGDLHHALIQMFPAHE